jgi:hypothetical protein
MAEIGRFPYFRTLVRDHFSAVVGLPSAAVASFFIVATPRQVSGPIEINTAAFKLKGASGPIVLWVVCFLAIAVAIKWVW